MRCPDCGHVMHDKEKVCPRCAGKGTADGGKRLSGIVFLLLAVVLIVLAGGWLWWTQRPQSTGRRQPVAAGTAGTRTLPATPGSTKQVSPAEKARLATISQINTAAESGDTAKVKKMLADDPALVNAKDSGKFNLAPLHLACQRGKLDVVILLVEKGADIEAKTTDGYTPLHMAALHDADKVAAFLLSKKAKIDTQVDESGETALHLAVRMGGVKTVQVLLDHGAKLDIKDKQGLTPLKRAEKENRPEMLKLLQARGAKK